MIANYGSPPDFAPGWLSRTRPLGPDRQTLAPIWQAMSLLHPDANLGAMWPALNAIQLNLRPPSPGAYLALSRLPFMLTSSGSLLRVPMLDLANRMSWSPTTPRFDYRLRRREAATAPGSNERPTAIPEESMASALPIEPAATASALGELGLAEGAGRPFESLGVPFSSVLEELLAPLQPNAEKEPALEFSTLQRMTALGELPVASAHSPASGPFPAVTRTDRSNQLAPTRNQGSNAPTQVPMETLRGLGPAGPASGPMHEDASSGSNRSPESDSSLVSTLASGRLDTIQANAPWVAREPGEASASEPGSSQPAWRAIDFIRRIAPTAPRLGQVESGGAVREEIEAVQGGASTLPLHEVQAQVSQPVVQPALGAMANGAGLGQLAARSFGLVTANGAMSAEQGSVASASRGLAVGTENAAAAQAASARPSMVQLESAMTMLGIPTRQRLIEPQAPVQPVMQSLVHPSTVFNAGAARTLANGALGLGGGGFAQSEQRANATLPDAIRVSSSGESLRPSLVGTDQRLIDNGMQSPPQMELRRTTSQPSSAELLGQKGSDVAAGGELESFSYSEHRTQPGTAAFTVFESDKAESQMEKASPSPSAHAAGGMSKHAPAHLASAGQHLSTQDVDALAARVYDLLKARLRAEHDRREIYSR